ncbi:uncharacterized protein LOC141686739 isoform X1 [Apium graveolens]|uniref:uncharacterized protein LOC141686739 isoform X1 n=1 Tax=Apium graveolens TaxID=4045 RepID=UPI003D7A88A4
MNQTNKMEGESKKARITIEDEADRISKLPDELIHQILKYVDTKLAVQTSVLSKRWKLVWTTLPFLKFIWDYPDSRNASVNKNNAKFTRHVLNRRNHRTSLSYLELKFLTPGLLAKFVKYAISRNVEYLNVHLRYKHKLVMLSSFSSNSIRKLKLRMILECSVWGSDCWDLPALTSLHLSRLAIYYENQNLPDVCISCLPALRNLCLDDWILKESSLSFDWPALTTFSLIKCELPEKVWNFPNLKSLEFHDVTFPKNMSDIFTALVSLQNLTLYFKKVALKDFFVPCPELVNLEIRCRFYQYSESYKSNIVVSAPKLRNFTSVGIFTVKFEVSDLENVNIKLRGWIDDQDFSPNQLKEYHGRFIKMLPGLGGAKILNLELETIKAFSSISAFLVSYPSPFYNLKYVKLPHGCEEAAISSNLRSYLLGASPTATIVTTHFENIMNPHTTASVTSQNVVLQTPLVAPTKVLVDYRNIPKSVCTETVGMGMQDHVVQNSVQHDDRVRNVGSSVDVTDNDHVSSSSGNIDFGLWRGHAVNSEFVILLNAIMDKYPETFDHFTTKNKKFSTMKLNMFCTSVYDFAKISMTEVDTETVAEYRDVFADLQKLGFDVSWLVNRLNYVEQLWISQPLLPELHAIDCDINDAKSKLHDLQFNMDETKYKLQNLQTLRDKKMQEIQKAFGTMGANLAVGYIGDDLLSVPLFTQS